MKKIRNLKFVIDTISPELEAYKNEYFGCLSEINSRFVDYMKQGYKFEKRFVGYYCTAPTGQVFTDAQFCEEYLSDIRDRLTNCKCKTTFRGMYNLVARQYQGYMKRNTAPTKRIHLKEKTISWKDNELSLVDGKILVKNIFGDDFFLEFKDLGCLKHINSLGKKFAGNLVIKQRCLIVKVGVEYSFGYVPTTYMSIDINKANKNWLYLNDGTKIVKPDNIVKLEDIITGVNKSIKNKEINTKQRKRLRKKWKRLHVKHDKLIYDLVDQLLKQAEKNKSLVAIDTVKTGQSNGTFGQDKLIFHLITQCEDRGIPFIVTPCAYTSQRCTSCGHIDPKNRKLEKFICTKCGHTCHADYNGAINLVEFAEALYIIGMIGIIDKYAAMRYLATKFNFPKK